MGDGALFTLSVLFSLVTGTAAGVLSLLALEILRRSPFGRAVFVLSLVMVTFVLYHATLFFSPVSLVITEVVRSTLYTGVAVFVWVMVWSQYRIRHRSNEGMSA